MKNKVNASDKSIENAGIPSDYKQAIAELIWNGFDAKASIVDINFETNEFAHLSTFTISDNGEGINIADLNSTFGAFLDSPKKRYYQRTSSTHGKRGKGRFSFTNFASKAVWETRFLNEENKLLQYKITINKSSKNVYDVDDKKSILNSGTSGTDLHLYELDNNFSSQHLYDKQFTEYLAHEFGWFLYLNKDKDYAISINGIKISYEHIIDESDNIPLVIKDIDNTDLFFSVSYIRWTKRIGDKSYYYILDSNKYEIGKILTSFNNNAIDFFHSLYVESKYFDHFIFEKKEGESRRIDGLKNQEDAVYKRLVKELQSLLREKEKLFVREKAAKKLLINYESEGTLPVFKNNKYDLERKSDLLNVIKEIYCIQPKIFKGLKREQRKTCVGFLNLLLDTDERENILTILGDVVKLTSEEREQLAHTLHTTSLNKIIRTIKMIQNRYSVVEMLRGLVFDLKKFSTERDHIQTVVEDNYWLFGEQFHLVSADDTFEKSLSNYLYLLDGVKKETHINSDEHLRRPDIFMCRKHKISDTQNFSDMLEENIIVELKRPTVVIGKEQFRQVEDYLDLIKQENQFNSQMRHWKFFIVSNKVDDFIKDQYKSFQVQNRRFLVHMKEQFEIYAMTWDDIFQLFEIRHNYLLDKLNFDKKIIEEEFWAKGITLNKLGSNKIVSEIKSLETV
jgi:hypothetical protein